MYHCSKAAGRFSRPYASLVCSVQSDQTQFGLAILNNREKAACAIMTSSTLFLRLGDKHISPQVAADNWFVQMLLRFGRKDNTTFLTEEGLLA